MIKATIQECRSALVAFSRIFEETKLDQKAAWRVSRLIGKLHPVVRDFEKTQLKLYKDAGGVQVGNGVEVRGVTRRDGETDEAWEQRNAEHNAKLNKLMDELRDLNQSEVEVQYDAIPLSMLPTERKNAQGEKEPVEYRATDLTNAGPFLTDAAVTT